MNKSQLIWGIVCLMLAAGLAVANLALPPEKLMFNINGVNQPWVPVAGLAVVGIVLLATAGRSESRVEEAAKAEVAGDPAKAALNKRLEAVAWGLFLIMLGGFALVPQTSVPQGAWSIGVGLIMLGLNGARYLNRIKMSGFTTFLGILSVLGGISELIGLTSLGGALLLILLGAYLILKPWFERQQVFGKAEES